MKVPIQSEDVDEAARARPLAGGAEGPHGIPADLVDHLRCPVTDGSVRWMSEGELKSLNSAAALGEAKHLDGSTVSGQLTAGLINSEGSLAYRVDDDIIMMLPISAIALDGKALARFESIHRPEKVAVQSFYNQIGWKTDEQGDFEDAVIWEDLRPVSADYLHKCHARVKRYLNPTGNYLLDVASGPVQYADYLMYSEGYNHRICMDISIQALRQARKKVGAKGVYILGDITDLPLRSNSIDGVVSIHTVYHVPVDEQATAFEELYRVLKPGCSGAVVYTFTRSILELIGAAPSRFLTRARHSLPARLVKRALGHRAGPTPPPRRRALKSGSPFYFKAHDLQFFECRKWSFPLKIVVWRSVNVWWLRTYAHPDRMGKFLLAMLYKLEELFPRFMGRKGPYPMFILKK